MNKIYWYENTSKLIGTLVQHNNYVLLTAQEKNRLSNIIDKDYLEDIGISFYSLSRIVPENVTYYNLKDNLKIITDMSIAGYYMSQFSISDNSDINKIENTLKKYNMIIKTCLDKLDNSFQDTAKTRILYSYFNKLITINLYSIKFNIDVNLKIYILLDTYEKFINFSLNTMEYTLIDCTFLQYCLSDYLNLCKNSDNLTKKEDLSNKILDSMNLIEDFLFVKNSEEYLKSINKIHLIFEQIKSIHELQYSPNLLTKNILNLNNNTRFFLNTFNPYLLKKIDNITNNFNNIKDIHELVPEDNEKTIFDAYKKASIYEKPFLLNSERNKHIVSLMKTKINIDKIKVILLKNNINDINDDIITS